MLCKWQCYLVLGEGAAFTQQLLPPCVNDLQCTKYSPMQLEGFSLFAANKMCCAHVLSKLLSSLDFLLFISLYHSLTVNDFLFVCSLVVSVEG